MASLYKRSISLLAMSMSTLCAQDTICNTRELSISCEELLTSEGELSLELIPSQQGNHTIVVSEQEWSNWGDSRLALDGLRQVIESLSEHEQGIENAMIYAGIASGVIHRSSSNWVVVENQTQSQHDEANPALLSVDDMQHPSMETTGILESAPIIAPLPAISSQPSSPSDFNHSLWEDSLDRTSSIHPTEASSVYSTNSSSSTGGIAGFAAGEESSASPASTASSNYNSSALYITESRTATGYYNLNPSRATNIHLQNNSVVTFNGSGAVSFAGMSTINLHYYYDASSIGQTGPLIKANASHGSINVTYDNFHLHFDETFIASFHVGMEIILMEASSTWNKSEMIVDHIELRSSGINTEAQSTLEPDAMAASSDIGVLPSVWPWQPGYIGDVYFYLNDATTALVQTDQMSMGQDDYYIFMGWKILVYRTYTFADSEAGGYTQQIKLHILGQVPEPSTGTLCLLALITLLNRRRRKTSLH